MTAISSSCRKGCDYQRCASPFAPLLSPPERPGESRDPFLNVSGADRWIPAFAGTVGQVTTLRSARSASCKGAASHIEAEMHDVAVLHDVIGAFEAHP